MIITLELLGAILVATMPIWIMLAIIIPLFYLISHSFEDRGDKKIRKAREAELHREAKAARIRKKLEDKPLSKGWHKLDDLPMAKPKLPIKPKPFPMQGIAQDHAEEMARRRSGSQ